MWLSTERGPKTVGKTWRISLVILAVLFAPVDGKGQIPGRAATGTEPVVIALDVARDPAERDLEQRFMTQLALALDDYEVIRIGSEAHQFMGLPLSEQLKRIEGHMSEKRACAAVWMEGTESGVISLHLVVFSTGRALVRIVEVDEGPNAAKDLALAAQELLSQAYDFDAAARSETAQAPVASPEVDQLPRASEAEIGYVAFGTARGGILGHRGASVLLGGGLGIEVWFERSLFLRSAVGISAGPNDSGGAEQIRCWGLSPELMLGYSWEKGSMKTGPVLGVGAAWTEFDITVDAEEEQTFSKWRFRGSVGIDLRLALTGYLSLFANGLVSAYSSRERFELDSTEELILSTPFVEWAALVGFVFFP